MTTSLLPNFSTLLLLLSILCFSSNSSPSPHPLTPRQTLEIDLGGDPPSITIGIGTSNHPPPVPTPICPPSNPPPPPSPSGELTPADFPNLLLYQSYLTIQRFKKTVSSDPLHITNTWTGPDISKYTGFFLEPPPRFKNSPAVAAIDFNGFRLAAPSLSGFLDQFPDLAVFHANSNSFSGQLPPLTHLPYLYELDFSNNNFAGIFPSSVFPLFQLSFLDLRYNHFAGAIPPSVFTFPLEALFLNNNQFSHQIPLNIGLTTYLTLANNNFTGPIPNPIGSNILQVLFLNNKLSGCLPAGIGKLEKATVFDAGFNEITGPIPASFGCLSGVEQLNLAGNLLYGEVPGEVCGLGSRGRLMNFSLSGNYLTSLGNGCLELVRRGVLDVRRNCIEGFEGQRSPEECALFLGCRKYCPAVGFVSCYSG